MKPACQPKPQQHAIRYYATAMQISRKYTSNTLRLVQVSNYAQIGLITDAKRIMPLAFADVEVSVNSLAADNKRVDCEEIRIDRHRRA